MNRPTKVWALIDDTDNADLLTAVATSADAAAEWEASGDDHVALACWLVPAPDDDQHYNEVES
jgi:hypothetical protein